VRPDGEEKEYRRTADSGNRVTYRFCPSCGATVYYQAQAIPGCTAIPIGAFADPDFPAPRVSVYEGRKHSWVAAPPNAERID
jgi:hypothetical protein